MHCQRSFSGACTTRAFAPAALLLTVFVYHAYACLRGIVDRRYCRCHGVLGSGEHAHAPSAHRCFAFVDRPVVGCARQTSPPPFVCNRHNKGNLISDNRASHCSFCICYIETLRRYTFTLWNFPKHTTKRRPHNRKQSPIQCINPYQDRHTLRLSLARALAWCLHCGIGQRVDNMSHRKASHT